jgi:hypothetical protein
MNKFTLLITLFFSYFQIHSQVIYGENSYTQYHMGSMPLVISVPHGGHLEPETIPDRTCNNPTTVTDSYTIELARQLDTALFNLTGCRPHLIICNLKRTKVDCNRDLADGACGNQEAETAWTEFQHFIDTAQSISEASAEGKTFYIDLHGHGKPILRLELGYGLSASDLNNTDSFLNLPAQLASSSIQALAANNATDLSHAELLRGEFSLGTLLANAGFPAVPSQQTPNPDTTAYFSGGHNTSNHTCISPGNTVNGLQLECHQTVRFSYAGRKLFADSLAQILARYLNFHQLTDLESNCGLPSTSSLSADKEEDFFVVYPNPFDDVIHLSTQQIHGNFRVQLLTSLGQVISVTENQTSISTAHLSSGIYFLLLSDEQTELQRKIVVKN